MWNRSQSCRAERACVVLLRRETLTAYLHHIGEMT